jgi:hypothetical protein
MGRLLGATVSARVHAQALVALDVTVLVGAVSHVGARRLDAYQPEKLLPAQRGRSRSRVAIIDPNLPMRNIDARRKAFAGAAKDQYLLS